MVRSIFRSPVRVCWSLVGRNSSSHQMPSSNLSSFSIQWLNGRISHQEHSSGRKVDQWSRMILHKQRLTMLQQLYRFQRDGRFLFRKNYCLSQKGNNTVSTHVHRFRNSCIELFVFEWFEKTRVVDSCWSSFFRKINRNVFSHYCIGRSRHSGICPFAEILIVTDLEKKMCKFSLPAVFQEWTLTSRSSMKQSYEQSLWIRSKLHWVELLSPQTLWHTLWTSCGFGIPSGPYQNLH